MNKIIQIKVFNGLLDNFFDFLETISIDVHADIMLTRSMVDLVRKSNPRLVVEQFRDYSLQFRKEIEDCNEIFFLNYHILINDNSNLILKLKYIWKILDKRQKATIFYYFNKLLKISDQCI